MAWDHWFTPQYEIMDNGHGTNSVSKVQVPQDLVNTTREFLKEVAHGLTRKR